MTNFEKLKELMRLPTKEEVLEIKIKDQITELSILTLNPSLVIDVYNELSLKLYKNHYFGKLEAHDYVFSQLKTSLMLGFTDFNILKNLDNQLIIPTLFKLISSHGFIKNIQTQQAQVDTSAFEALGYTAYWYSAEKK